jgi:hypothetical protein
MRVVSFSLVLTSQGCGIIKNSVFLRKEYLNGKTLVENQGFLLIAV